MIDSSGRNIDYLRLSLTERCNLRCIYCRDQAPGVRMAGQGGVWMASDTETEISAAETGHILTAMVALGINKVRITGGEPLLRDDLEDIIRNISSAGSIQDICMTTNAQGLAGRVRRLKQAGLMRLNTSLDSLQPDRYRKITRGGNLQDVLDAIDASLDAGLYPVKVNCVPMRGINDDEIGAFIAMTRDKPIQVRFIELMPLGEHLNESLRIESGEILEAYPELRPASQAYHGQPAENYAIPGFLGMVGFISPISRRFCTDCNRVRITCDGRLRPCLGDNTEIDLRQALGRGSRELCEIIRNAVYNKPLGHRFNRGFVPERPMFRIGG